EGDDRDRVHRGVLERGDQVGGGRTRGDQADPDPARRAGVALGGVTRGGLLAHEDVPEPLEVVERVVDGEDGAAGQAEDQVDALPLQALEEDARARQFHSSPPVASTSLMSSIASPSGVPSGGRHGPPKNPCRSRAALRPPMPYRSGTSRSTGIIRPASSRASSHRPAFASAYTSHHSRA